MSRAFSIVDAAKESGDAPALRDADRDYTFAELAAEVAVVRPSIERQARPGKPHPVVGSSTVATLVTLYALLEARIPALLLHPQLTPAEQQALIAYAERSSQLPPEAAVVAYTSGTTGEPRAAVLTHAALAASAAASAANLGWRDGDCWLLCMPVARVGGLSIVTRCLAARRCIALSPFDAATFPEVVAARRATLASVVPTMLARILDAHPDWTGGKGTGDEALRAILVGGAAASPRLLERARARRLPIIITYGMTETCSQVAATPYAARFAPAACGAGAALPGIDLRVVEGQFEVRGPVLMAGYWNEPPLEPGAWFPTGDAGEIDANGCLHVHARRADLIVTGGENVYPAEVERVLEACPGVAAAAVFGIPDDVWGQIVAAALVTENGEREVPGLVAYIEERLATYKRPRDVCYVTTLPQTSAGKLDRSALARFAGLVRPLRRGSRDAG